MKTYIPILLLLIAFSLSGFSQSERGQKIKAMKTAFITQELNLTPAEAEKFWPVYNKYDSQIWALKRKEREEVTKVMRNNIQTLNDSQASDLLQKMNSLKQDEQKLQQQMEAELLKQISPVKLLQLRKAEHDFQMQLLKKYRGGKKE
ncbi:MAG: sensor of ECF-type sigma factor [Flavobacteriaceae bacterium]|nr:sensor of ECF-type sigma factor [Flavobacteriaceae bacterium]